MLSGQNAAATPMEVEDDLGAEEITVARREHDHVPERVGEQTRRDRAHRNHRSRGDRQKHGHTRRDRGHDRGEGRRYWQRDQRPKHHNPHRH